MGQPPQAAGDRFKPTGYRIDPGHKKADTAGWRESNYGRRQIL